MTDLNQGDIISISGFSKRQFVVVSKNAFIRATGVIHVCPMIKNIADGPLHIPVRGNRSEGGVVICEQVKLIDPAARGCSRLDNLPYGDIMNVSDAVQGMFEYD